MEDINANLNSTRITPLERSLQEATGAYDANQGQDASFKIRQAQEALDAPIPSTLESMGNSFSNLANRLKGTIPRLQVVSSDLWENVLGKELAKKAYEFEGRDINQVRNEAYQELEQLATEVKPTLGITQSIESNNWKGLSAGLVNTITSLGSTAIPSMLTAGAGIFTEMTGDAIVDYNEAKAKKLGISVNDLYKKGEAEFNIPAMIGATSGALELIGLKGVNNLITKKFTGSAFKKATLIFAESQKEGLTEFLQTGLEEANRSLGKGDSNKVATEKAVNKMFSKEGLESYLQGVVGSIGAGGLARISKNITNPSQKLDFSKEVATISMIEMDLAKPNISEESKRVLNEQAQNSISNMAEIIDSDEKSTNNLNEEQKAKVNDVNSKIEKLDVVLNDASVSPELKKNLATQKLELEKEVSDVINSPINNNNSESSTLEDFKKDYEAGNLERQEATGGRNIGIYGYKDKIVKLVKSKRAISQATIDLMNDRLSDMDNVFNPTGFIRLEDGSVAILMDKATGKDAGTLTKTEIEFIPQEHWAKLEADVRELSERGVKIDLTKRSNMFYDKNKGFQFLDIDNIQEEPTGKFFKDESGKEFYYPFERNKVLPKEFTTMKALFNSIKLNEQEQNAYEGAKEALQEPITPEPIQSTTEVKESPVESVIETPKAVINEVKQEPTKESIPAENISSKRNEEVLDSKKDRLKGNQYTATSGETFDINIFDGINGKVENVSDIKNKDRLSLTVTDENGKSIGNAGFWKDKDGKWYSNVTNVNTAHRRKGIASAMYQFAKNNGYNIKSSEFRSEQGNKFTNSFFNENKPYDLEQKQRELKSKEVITKAEDDLKALKQVTNKVQKYTASVKRLNDAYRAGEITEKEFNDTKLRFDDVIADSSPNMPKAERLSTEETKQLDNELKNENLTTNDFIQYERARAIQEATDVTEAIQQPTDDTGGSGQEASRSKTAQGETTKDRESLTPEEATRKKELRKKFAGRFNDVTNIIATLADKEFREYAGLILKEAKGDFKNFSKDMIESVGEKIREHLPKLYAELSNPTVSQEENKRATTQKVLNSNKYSQNFKEAITEKAIYYTKLPNELTDSEADAIIDIKGLGESEALVFDLNNGMSLPVRFKVAQRIINSYESTGETLKAVEVYEKIVERITDTAQGLQSLSAWPQLSKASQVAQAKKTVSTQRESFKKKTKKTTDKITKEFKKANKESAEETVVNVKKAIEKATVVNTEGTIKELPMYGSKNRLFTRDKYLKAKQKLRGVSMSSIGGLPLDDVINIAGYHIEATGRDFARFSRRMKADLGAKIKPFLKDIYAQTRKSLTDEGYDEGLFLTDEEVDAQINEEEGQKFKEKLEKAIARKDAKEQSQAIKKLQEISKEEGVWGQYKASAASRLKIMVLTNAEKDIRSNPSLQQFTDSLVKNMREKMADMLPEQTNKKKIVPRPDIEVIGDAYKNPEKYQEVWERTQQEFQDKYADNPEVLQSIDEYFGEILDKPFSDKVIERAVNKGLKDMDKNISDLVIQHYTVVDNTKQSLASKLVDEAGLTGAEASDLSKAVEAEFDRIATKKKQQILEKIFSKKERKKPAVKTLEGDIIKMSNLGAFNSEEVIEMYGDKMGWPTLTEQNIKEIERLSDLSQGQLDPVKKRRAVEDLLAYQAKIKGNSITDLVTAIWYANVLSGYNTQVVNFGANAINTALLYANAVAQRPKDARFIGKGLLSGLKKGYIEAKETLNTGYSPIKGRAEVPSLLELKTFKGGEWNPANALKYVRRIMVAADVIFFEGIKEMRAYQLAKAQASKDFKLDPSLDQWNRAIELVGNSDGQVEQIKNQVELEYQAEIEAIEKGTLSPFAKKEALKQANTDKQRIIFDRIEQLRSSDIIQESSEFAAEGTYNYQPKGFLGAVANGINTIVKDVPLLRYAVPFTNIIANVANETINYTPLAFGRLKNGGFSNFRREELSSQQRADLTTKAAIGTTLMATAFILSQVKGDDDEPFLDITANGTGDFAKNETLKTTGWQPYSFRFKLPNGEYTGWLSYQYSPLIAVLGYVGHVNDLTKYKKEDDEDTIIAKMSKAAGLTTSTFFQATYLSGLGDVLQSVLDPRSSEKVTDKLLKGVVGAVKGVAIPNLYSQSAQSMEEIMGAPRKEIRDNLMGVVLQDIPYARNIYYDKINILGDTIMPDTDKFLSTNKPNKIIQLLVDKKAVFAPINRKAEKIYDVVEEKERALTDEEFYRYSKDKGQYIKNALETGYDKLSKLSNEAFKAELTKIKKEATKAARYAIQDIDSSVLEIRVGSGDDSKVYELTPKQVKQRIKLNKAYMKENASDLNDLIYDFKNEDGLSDKDARVKADGVLRKRANQQSRAIILDENTDENDQYTLIEK